MAVKAALFDIDNTLIDFMRMKHMCCEAAIDAMISAGLDMKRDKALKLLFELYDKYGIEYRQIFQKLLKKARGRVDYKIVAHGIVAYRKMREGYLIPYARAVPTLLELKKHYKLAVVSDAPRMEAWMRLVTMKIDDFFDVIITKGDVKKQKTHAAPFRAALRELKIKPEEAVMVGDRIPRDIITAKALGIHTVYARYGDESPAEKGRSGADFEINDISEILKVMKRIG